MKCSWDVESAPWRQIEEGVWGLETRSVQVVGDEGLGFRAGKESKKVKGYVYSS